MTSKAIGLEESQNPMGAAQRLHLVKLCVGADSIDDLGRWIEIRLAQKRAAGIAAEQTHTTRMVPKAREQLLAGGSLYWVIKGIIQVRQRLLDIRPFEDEDGVRRCHLVLEPQLIATRYQPRRPFQGWRYLKASDAPADVDDNSAADIADMPPTMRDALNELGLL